MEHIYNDINIKPINSKKLVLYSTLNNNEIIRILNNFFRIFNIIYIYENNTKINCITHFIGKITGPSVILFDIELQNESLEDYVSSIYLINNNELQNYYLKELYDLLKKYLNNNITFNDFNNIFTFSSNNLKDYDIIQSLNICRNMINVDTLCSLKMLLLLAYQSPESCLGEIDNLFKLLSNNIIYGYNKLIPQYIIVILSILSNNRKSINKIIFYLPIMIDDYYILENMIQTCNIKFVRYYLLIIFGNIFNDINIIQYFSLFNKIDYDNLLRLRTDFISNNMIQNMNNIDNYIFRKNMIFVGIIVFCVILIIYF